MIYFLVISSNLLTLIRYNFLFNKKFSIFFLNHSLILLSLMVYLFTYFICVDITDKVSILSKFFFLSLIFSSLNETQKKPGNRFILY